MIKTCVVLNGRIINVGDWDYQYEEKDGAKVSKNPIPEGATFEEREFEHSLENGWTETGISNVLSTEDRIQVLEDAVNSLLGL